MTRGTSNGNASGNADDRRRRRQWLLDTYGDGVTAQCGLGGVQVAGCLVTVDIVTLTVDRIVPGCRGGTYARGNIRPACGSCNEKQGGQLGIERRAGR